MCYFFLGFLNTSPGSSAVLFPSLGTNPIQYTHPHHSPIPGRFLFWVLLFHTSLSRYYMPKEPVFFFYVLRRTHPSQL